MAAKTWYFLNTTAVTPNFFGNMQDGGSAPGAATLTAGWQPAKTAVTTPYFRGRWGAVGKATASSASSHIDAQSGPVKGTGTAITTAGDSFITPTPYTGTFAAGAWTLTLSTRPSTVTVTGRVRLRVWASVNADGSSARELTSGSLAGSINTESSTSTTYAAGLTWSPGAITLNNEYIFFAVEWQETTAGTANGSACSLYASVAAVTTTNFVEVHALLANNLAVSAPTIDVTGPTTAVIPSPPDLTVGAPTIEQSTIAQVHALQANAFQVVALALDQGALNQHHILALPTNLSVGAPTIPALTPVQTIPITGTGFEIGSPSVLAALLTPNHPDIVLGDRVLDRGLTVLRDEADEVWICFAQPTSYAEAVSYKLGDKPSTFGDPDTVAGGRRIIHPAITDGLVTAVGDAHRWAVVDTINSRLLATGDLSGDLSTINGASWSLNAIAIVQPR